MRYNMLRVIACTVSSQDRTVAIVEAGQLNTLLVALS